MIEWLDHIDKDLFIFLNGLHTNSLDAAMLWITAKNPWIPLYLLIVGFIIYTKRWKSIRVFIAIALLITLSDQITSGLMKPFFERLRPCHNPILADVVYNIGKCGGQFGFASSHAANTFAIATFTWLVFKKDHGWFIWMFLWAALVSYSRIYVGVHYPGDVTFGAIIGVSSGVGIHSLYAFLIQKFSH